jgi:hypothetical protein
MCARRLISIASRLRSSSIELTAAPAAPLRRVGLGHEEPFPVPRPNRREGSNFPVPGREWEGPEAAVPTDRPPGFAPELPGGPFQGLVPTFLALTNPSFAHSRRGRRTYLLGMQSEREWARAVVRDTARRYPASRRECVDPFVDRRFSLTGTLQLYRHAIGWDLLQVPANLLLSPATLAVSVASRIAARLGFAHMAAWLDRHRPSFDRRWRARSHGSSRRSCCSSLAHSPTAITPRTPLPTQSSRTHASPGAFA